MARLLGVNEFTLRSWELDKRLPDEPAVLIKIVEGVEKFQKVIDDTS
jgi:DNA-binding transcriptional regulator YiaG